MTVAEWCPHCQYEVELKEKFERQKCPKCEVAILPCAQCITRECSQCPLENN